MANKYFFENMQYCLKNNIKCSLSNFFKNFIVNKLCEFINIDTIFYTPFGIIKIYAISSIF